MRRKLTEEETIIKGINVSLALKNSDKWKALVEKRRREKDVLILGDKEYITFKHGKETFVDNGMLLYRLLAEHKIGRKLLPNECVHHIDGNHYNNDIDNLQVLTTAEHTSIHHKDKTLSEESRKKLSDSMVKRYADNPELGKKHSERMKGRVQSEELRRRKSETMKANIAKRRELGLLKMSDEQKEKIRIALKKYGEEAREKGIIPGSHNTTEEAKEKNRLAHLGKKHSEETKLKMSLAHKKRSEVLTNVGN